jgi:CDP-diacylglycerol--serine O-phosphatidyltransferase
MKKLIPSIFTAANLLSGCLALYFLNLGGFDWVFWLLIFAAVLDFFDGFLARILGTESPIGKELDSLADVVSFGVVPGFILQSLILQSDGGEVIARLPYLSWCGFIFTLAAALRLAKFNVMEDGSEGFTGLPTPSATAIVVGLMMVQYFERPAFAFIYQNHLVIILLILVVSALMLSGIQLLGIKFKSFDWARNRWRYILLITCAVMIPIMKERTLLIFPFIYIIISIFAVRKRNVNPKM